MNDKLSKLGCFSSQSTRRVPTARGGSPVEAVVTNRALMALLRLAGVEDRVRSSLLAQLPHLSNVDDLSRMPHVELTDALCTCGVENDVAHALAYELTGEAHTETYPWYVMRVGVTSSLGCCFFSCCCLLISLPPPCIPPHLPPPPPRPRSGHIYFGITIGARPHGHGVMESPDGRVYDGAFRDGVRHGEGLLTYPTGETYTGRWENDEKRHGVHAWPNGQTYEGQWLKNMHDGVGALEWAGGANTYTGQWMQGRFVGNGTRLWEDGQSYVGSFRNGKRSGKGVWRHPDGHRYDGQWRDDEFNGEGEYTTGGRVGQGGGQRCVGEWRNGELITAKDTSSPPAVLMQEIVKPLLTMASAPPPPGDSTAK